MKIITTRNKDNNWEISINVKSFNNTLSLGGLIGIRVVLKIPLKEYEKIAKEYKAKTGYSNDYLHVFWENKEDIDKFIEEYLEPYIIMLKLEMQ